MHISKIAIGKVVVGLVLSFAAFQFGVTDATAADAVSAPVPKIAASAAKEPQATDEQVRVMGAYGKLPLSFEMNQGQTVSDVKFLSRGRGYQLYLTPTEAVMTFPSAKKKEQERHAVTVLPQDAVPTSSSLKGSAGARHDAPSPPQVVKMEFLGAAANPKISGESPLSGKVNYFVGNDKSKWMANVPTYGKVRYEGVYPGIDLVHYGTQDGQLEYDFVVAPGANPDRISLGISGGKLTLDADGSLVLIAPVEDGDVKQVAPEVQVVRWGKPRIYQEIGGRRVSVEGGYKMKRPLMNGPQVVSFQIAAYDRSRPLIIDPLVYSTYLGGQDGDSGQDIAVDASGAAYVTGWTTSPDFPVLGAYDPYCGTDIDHTCNWGNPNGGIGVSDIFVTKISATGNAILYSTFLGGSGGDYGYGIAVDSTGAAYVTGSTASPDFPTTSGAYDSTYNSATSSGTNDAFVAKISAAGSSLVYSTYLGSSGDNLYNNGDDFGYGIAVDSAGNIYVTGETSFSDFPTKSGADMTHNGWRDAFVTKISVTNGLLYSTYLGGTHNDAGTGIAVNGAGEIYVAGSTASPNFPTTSVAYDKICGIDGACHNADVFVTKISAAGSIVYSTYLGGSSDDELTSGGNIVIDSVGAAYVTGYTGSFDFPATLGAYDTTHNGGYDVFVTKIAADGKTLKYATYIGGYSDDYGAGIAVDAFGTAYVTGWTASPSFPTTSGAYDTTFNGGADAFVAKISAAGDALLSSTYLGGSSFNVCGYDIHDQATGIVIDGAGAAYVVGSTCSLDFPTTPGAYDTTMSWYWYPRVDAFVTKINIGSTPYSWVTTPYSWRPTSTITGITGDDVAKLFSLPFPFSFYGQTYTQVYVASNGFLSFGSAGGNVYSPTALPNSAAPNALIAGLWRDLYPTAVGCTGIGGACITYSSSATEFVVSYNNIKNFSGTNRQTFQIILTSSGEIIFQYAAVTNGVSTTIGVENQTGTVGYMYQPTPINGLAIKTYAP